jgi:glycogen debranching enzyme
MMYKKIHNTHTVKSSSSTKKSTAEVLPRFCSINSSSLIRARKELSDLHVRLADEGFTEVFVDQLTKDMVAVTRHCPQDRR